MNTEVAISPASSSNDPTLVALSHGDLAPAQAQLRGWCQQKIRTLARDLREQVANHRHAQQMHWKRTGWAAAARKTKQQIVYYTKIRQAVEAGYLIVPTLDVDVVAVRVGRDEPNAEVDEVSVTPDVMPPGRGRYVGAKHVGYKEDREVKRSDGTKYTISDFHPTEFNEEVDFPVRLVKPIILAATQQAMAKRLFDRIGVVRGRRKSDPLVVGQIINPRLGNRYKAYSDNPTCVSFFIAWWLDTNDLE